MTTSVESFHCLLRDILQQLHESHQQGVFPLTIDKMLSLKFGVMNNGIFVYKAYKLADTTAHSIH